MTVLGLFLGSGFGQHFLYNVVNLHPYFFRKSVYQILSLETIHYLHCIKIYVILESPIGFPYFLQFKSEFGNKEFMVWATVSSWSCFCLNSVMFWK